MKTPYAAYFVGGPEDMTKRIMPRFMEVIRVPEMPAMDVADAHIEPEAEVDRVAMTMHLYRARAELRPWGQPMKYIVYEYMGRE